MRGGEEWTGVAYKRQGSKQWDTGYGLGPRMKISQQGGVDGLRSWENNMFQFSPPRYCLSNRWPGDNRTTDNRVTLCRLPSLSCRRVVRIKGRTSQAASQKLVLRCGLVACGQGKRGKQGLGIQTLMVQTIHILTVVA